VRKIFVEKKEGRIYTVMDYVDGAEMFDTICAMGAYSEKVAKNLFS
jgi:hypothetical protein